MWLLAVVNNYTADLNYATDFVVLSTRQLRNNATLLDFLAVSCKVPKRV
jgi:hypothetical protein